MTGCGAQEVLEDADAAIGLLQASPRPPKRQERRAVREALGHLYSVFEHVRSDDGSFFARAEESPDGLTMLAVMYGRGRIVHALAGTFPEHVGDFDPDDFTDDFVLAELTWRADDELRHRTSDARPGSREAQQRRIYRDHAAGCAVLPTLQSARRYLAHELQNMHPTPRSAPPRQGRSGT